MEFEDVKVYVTYYDKNADSIVVKDYFYDSFNSDSLENLKKLIKENAVPNAYSMGIVITKDGGVMHEEDDFL